MNLPNKITLSRLGLTLLFLIALFSATSWGDTLALILFIAASLTDYFDGMIARRDKLITDFGVLLDPLADKILVCSTFIAFVGRDLMPAWMVVIIVARELAITGLRLLAASKHVVLAAEKYGKHKTISQIVSILTILLAVCYPHWSDWSSPVLSGCLKWLPPLSQWIAVILTCTSGIIYLWRNRMMYLSDI
jgi:CDP-diacylglycerol---glycerol-3-phosphate 3-phosphatidyltransferase